MVLEKIHRALTFAFFTGDCGSLACQSDSEAVWYWDITEHPETRSYLTLWTFGTLLLFSACLICSQLFISPTLALPR